MNSNPKPPKDTYSYLLGRVIIVETKSQTFKGLCEEANINLIHLNTPTGDIKNITIPHD